METCLPARSDGIFRAEKPLEVTLLVDDPAETVPCSRGSLSIAGPPATEGSVKTAGIAAPTALHEPAEYPKGAAKARKRKRRRAKKKPATVEKETSGFEIQPPPVESYLKRPRRKQKANVRLLYYDVGLVWATTDVQIPATYKQARASKYWPEWRAGMLVELQSLKGPKTWKLVPRKAAKQVMVITCRWVFAVKRDKRGRIKRFKARLMIHGFKQQLGNN
ncbi:hypothetical protein PI124_g20075 [Phytophthora idaei]|nr:hypothetical protein PI124_g20075 [Phytophthora idaei]